MRSVSSQSSTFSRTTPSAASAGWSSRVQSLACVAVNSRTRSRIEASVASGVAPSGDRTVIPDAAWPASPATRIMKNSSRLDEKIEQNLMRSSSGTSGSAASSRTREFMSSHESSRFSNLCSAPTRFFRRVAAMNERSSPSRARGGVTEW